MPISPSSKAGAAPFVCPEACKLPSPAGPVPVPYPNAANLAPSTSNATKVNVLQTHGLSKAGASDAVEGKAVTGAADKAMLRGMKANQPVILNPSKIPMSMGDQAGTAGGVVSGARMGAGMGAGAGMAARKGLAGAISPSQAKIIIAP